MGTFYWFYYIEMIFYFLYNVNLVGGNKKKQNLTIKIFYSRHLGRSIF